MKKMSAVYTFDYQKAKPDRFTSRMQESPLVVVLDPDVARVFTSAEEVNQALRALISAMPVRPTEAVGTDLAQQGKKSNELRG